MRLDSGSNFIDDPKVFHGREQKLSSRKMAYESAKSAAARE